MNRYKMIYLAHAYGERTHFQALYECANFYHYQVSEQIILSNRSLFGKIGRCILKGAWLEAINYMRMKIKFYFIKNEILIVALAPYDYALIKYKRIIARNQSYFFSSHSTWDGSDFPKGKLKNKKQFENILSVYFKGCFCVNSRVERGLRPFIKKCIVVNHAIDVDQYVHNVPKGDNNIPMRSYVYVGQLIPRKNIGYLLQWMKTNPGEDIKITFIGHGNLVEDVRKASIEDKRIIYEGFYTKEQLKKELCNYDFLILPSTAEPFGIVLLEAFASGVPCIVSNAVGPSEIVEDNKTGFMFDINDGFKGFEAVMRRSLDLPGETLQQMKMNALNESTKYDVKVIAKKWMEMFDV